MNLQLNETLLPYNTLALQARAQALATIRDDADLVAALDWARQRKLPVIPLGEGSNVVLANDLDALVLRLQTRGIELRNSSTDKVSLRVAAGESWHGFVQWTLAQCYYGLENLALIPGTVGAAPIQNIGAYGVELQSTVLQVHGMVIADGSAITLDRTACEFGYRDSVFKHALRDKIIITAVDMELSRSANVDISYPALGAAFQGAAVAPSPRDVFDAVVNIRRSKLPDPAQVPNAGSFFKNPVLSADRAAALAHKYPALPRYPQPDGTVKLPAAWMIDHCGWKGCQRDGFGVHPEHALVLVNCGYGNGNSDGRELLGLAHDIAESVSREFGVELLIEPRVYR
jgi:UDP-N-acetylmuramate dehydrogenase